MLVIKLHFENSTKPFDMCLSDIDSDPFTEQQESFLKNCDYENLEFRMIHYFI